MSYHCLGYNKRNINNNSKQITQNKLIKHVINQECTHQLLVDIMMTYCDMKKKPLLNHWKAKALVRVLNQVFICQTGAPHVNKRDNKQYKSRLLKIYIKIR